jgi:hypothetical protein
LLTDLILGTFALPLDEEIQQPISYSELMKRVRSTWKLESQLSVSSKSGLIAKGTNKVSRIERDPKDVAPAKQTPVSELRAEVESQLGIDGKEIDATINFTFSGMLQDSSNVIDISFQSPTAFLSGSPKVMYLSKLESVKDASGKTDRHRYVAVIVKSTVINVGGWEIKPK